MIVVATFVGVVLGIWVTEAVFVVVKFIRFERENR